MSLPDGSYTWKVRMLDAQGNHSEWSTERQFSVQENIRDASPVLLPKAKYPDTTKRPQSEHAYLSPHPENRPEASIPSEHHSLSPRHSSTRKHATTTRKIASVNSKEDREQRKLRYLPIIEAAHERIESLYVDPSVLEIQSKVEIAHVVTSSKTRKPASQSTGPSVKVLLKWAVIPFASSYRVHIYKDEIQVHSKLVQGSEYEWEVPLAEIKESFSYRVTASDQEGKQTQGPMTQLQINLSPPTLLKPLPNSDHHVVEPIPFRWSSSASGVTYEVQIAKDLAFTQMFYQAELTKMQVLVPFPTSGAYYWRVRSLSGSIQDGQNPELQSKWSNPEKFYIH
jgi:hypothetical protein